MRDLMDRLREAETALDNQLNEAYYKKCQADRDRAIVLFWKAKQSIWYATMCALDAFAGAQTPVPVTSKHCSFRATCGDYKPSASETT